MRNVYFAMAVTLLGTPALADEGKVALKDAPGKDKVMANCIACHSVDYIQTNSPFPDRKLWEAEVAKMRNAFKARINDDDARVIVDYLAANYSVTTGKGK